MSKSFETLPVWQKARELVNIQNSRMRNFGFFSGFETCGFEIRAIF